MYLPSYGRYFQVYKPLLRVQAVMLRTSQVGGGPMLLGHFGLCNRVRDSHTTGFSNTVSEQLTWEQLREAYVQHLTSQDMMIMTKIELSSRIRL